MWFPPIAQLSSESPGYHVWPSVDSGEPREDREQDGVLCGASAVSGAGDGPQREGWKRTRTQWSARSEQDDLGRKSNLIFQSIH